MELLYQQIKYGVRVPRATVSEAAFILGGTTYPLLLEQKILLDFNHDGSDDATVLYVGLKGNKLTLTFSRLIQERVPSFSGDQSLPRQEEPSNIIVKHPERPEPPIIEQEASSWFAASWWRVGLTFILVLGVLYIRYSLLRKVPEKRKIIPIKKR